MTEQFEFDTLFYAPGEVREAIDSAKASIASGLTVMEFTSLGTSGRFTILVSPTQILSAARRYFNKVDYVTGNPKRVSKSANILV